MPLCICCMLYRVSFHRVYIRLWFMIITILYQLTSCLTPCVLLHQSPAVILLYYEYSLLDITCYISTCFCMLLLTTRFSMLVYDSDLSIHVCLSMHATWHTHHHLLGSSDSHGSSCLGLGAWSLWILPDVDHRCAAEVWITGRPSRALSFQAPCASLEFSLCNLVSAFCTIHTCTSPCILANAIISV